MTKKDFIKIEQGRATIYNIFSALFCQPEKETIKSDKIYEVLQSAFELIENDSFKDVEKIKMSAKKYTSDELLVEYTKLFLGPFKVLAPPYSSIYLGSDSLMSDVTMWVVDFYRDAKLEFDKELKDLPDHVVVETEFIYYLIFNELNEIELKNVKKSKDSWNKQSKFYIDHYKKWVPKFCKQIIKQTDNEFYNALAECFLKFLDSDKIPEYPKIPVKKTNPKNNSQPKKKHLRKETLKTEI